MGKHQYLEEKPTMKMQKLIKYYIRKIKKKMMTMMINSPTTTTTTTKATKNPSSTTSATRVVHCDELFRKSEKCKINVQGNPAANHDDPILVAYVLALNHFSLRPNIHL